MPITEACSKVFLERDHVCFGISPFNSYFSELRIQELAEWGRKEFKSMHFFVPDVPAAFTLEALGYEPEEAAWKARRQSQYLLNKIHRALRSLGVKEFEAREMVFNWEYLSTNERFLGLYQQITHLFHEDVGFQKACIEASRWVLEKKVENTEKLSLDALHSASRYLLTEIPLFMDTAGIAGKNTSVFCYHQCVPFIQSLMNGDFKVQPSNQQGFVVIEPTTSNE